MRFSAVTISHKLLIDIINLGDIVVDATAGNGNDTVFMCELTGPEGRVIALDIQKRAINATEELLQKHSIDNALCMQRNHALIEHELASFKNRISCVLFNLGYLPGSESKEICTEEQSTIQALNGAANLLNYRGAICVIAYRGHEKGKQEFEAVQQWMSELDAIMWHVIKVEAINQHEDAPVVFMATKKISTTLDE